MIEIIRGDGEGIRELEWRTRAPRRVWCFSVTSPCARDGSGEGLSQNPLCGRRAGLHGVRRRRAAHPASYSKSLHLPTFHTVILLYPKISCVQQSMDTRILVLVGEGTGWILAAVYGSRRSVDTAGAKVCKDGVRGSGGGVEGSGCLRDCFFK